MIPAGLLSTTATVTTPAAATDAYGSAVPDWAHATTRTIRCRIEQSSRSEQADETRDAAVAAFLLLCNDLAVTAGDRVTAGATYEVDGPPAVVQDALAAHHLEATLRLVAG